MTEAEYCTVSDLVILRDIKDMMRNLNCSADPNKSRRMGVVANIDLMIDDVNKTIAIEEP